MPSRHGVKKELPHELDLKGIAVALAFLLCVGGVAGSRDNRSASEDRQPLSASLHIEPTFVMEKSETVQNPNAEADLPDTSRTSNVSR